MPSRPRASFTSMASSPASSRSPALTGCTGACASPIPTSFGSSAPTRRTCPSCRSWTATPTPWRSSVRLLACRRPRSAWTISASPALVGTSTATTASTPPPSCGRPADSWGTRPRDGPHIRTTFAGSGAWVGVLLGNVGFSETAASNPGDAARLDRRRQRLRQELAVRAAVAMLIFVFDLSTGRGPNPVVRIEAVLGLALNLPYYAFGRTNRWPRAQAYVRMVVDIVMITIGLGSAGGLDAAGFLAVYTIVPLYCGLVFSSSACVVATVLSTGCYIALVSMQHAGWLPRPAVAPTGNAGMAAFNLLIVNVVGVLTAVLSEAYRRSRQRQVTLNRELERANDQAQLLNAEIQRAAQLRVLGEVVAGVTHELANVLTVASGHLGLARKKVASPCYTPSRCTGPPKTASAAGQTPGPGAPRRKRCRGSSSRSTRPSATAPGSASPSPRGSSVTSAVRSPRRTAAAAEHRFVSDFLPRAPRLRRTDARRRWLDGVRTIEHCDPRATTFPPAVPSGGPA